MTWRPNIAHTNRISRKRKEKPSLPKIGKRKVKSEYEFTIYKDLSSKTPRGSTIEYETEKLDYKIEHVYLPDFIITLKDETKVYVEVKGYFPYSERAKLLAVKARHPDIDLRIVFYRDNPSQLGRGSKSRPSDWALKNGFPYAVGEVPKEWFH